VGFNLVDLAVNVVTNKIYVSGEDVAVIDGATNTVIATVPIENPYGIAVNPTTNEVYVADIFGNSVSVSNGRANSVVANITLGAGCGPNGGSDPSAVVADTQTNFIYVIGRCLVLSARLMAVATPSWPPAGPLSRSTEWR